MAYVSHSPSRAYGRYFEWPRLDLSTLTRAALVALAAGAAVLALSGAFDSGAAERPALAKGDRVAAAFSVVEASSAAIVNDAAARTTTVEKGAVSALSAESPYIAATK